MAGMGQAPMWLARAAASEGTKRKTLVAIFLRGAADGLNIVVPFGDPQYREVRPTLALQPPRPQDEGPNNNGPFGPVIDLDGKFGLNAGLRAFKDLWDKKQLAIVEAAGSAGPSRLDLAPPGRRCARSRFPPACREPCVENTKPSRSVIFRTSTLLIRNGWRFSRTCI